jgi:hypothetical protein
MSEGGVDDGPNSNATNRSNISQDNEVFISDGAGGFQEDEFGPNEFNNPMSGNIADVAIRGQQNESIIDQEGVQNRAVVSILSGGSGQVQAGVVGPNGNPVQAGESQGNRSFVSQTGRNNFYEISAGGLGGQGNQTQVVQGSGSGAGLGTNHRATVFQRGILDNLSITQNNNSGQVTTTTGTGSGTAMQGDQDGSIADVSQLSFNSSTTIRQRGTNTAIVTQGANRTESGGGDNFIDIDQIDAGDTSSRTSGGVFTPGSGSTITQRNFAEVTQYGIGNTATVMQNATGARSTVFQTLGSRRNSVAIRQGGLLLNNAQGVGLVIDVTQRGDNGTATINQFGQFMSATVNQTGTGTRNLLYVLQPTGTNSVATVTQIGSNLSATTEQRGIGTAANPNRVTVTQTGSSHTANAIQESTSGPSGSAAPGSNTGGNTSAFPRARTAGTNSAEIEIFQSNGGPGGGLNSATVRQRGLGQLAVIDQRGFGNVAGILQSSTATNAVAIIEQTGDQNTFFISQTTAGQYMRVTQTGGGNVSTTSASGGTPVGGTGSGTTPPPGLLPGSF